MTAPEHPLLGVQPGQIIAGKYRVDRVLGQGGMGVVVAAHHLLLDVPVAVKFLLPGSLANPEVVDRFSREARAAAKITNDHVARVFDVGTLEDGAPYIVLEFLNGNDLSTRLRERGPLPIDEAVECVLQACEALAEAHSIGIVHRDLKPANLFNIRRPDGLPWIKVLDFGISKVLTSTSAMSMTQTGAVMGSPLYMSPEQMESSRNVDPRSDIWALGIVLYELLAGLAPFQGESLPELVIKITTRPPPPLRQFRPDCPEELELVVFRCLERDRNNRFQDVPGLVAALLPFALERPRVSTERSGRVAQYGGSPSTTASGWKSASAPPLPSPLAPTLPSPLGGTGTALGRTTGRGTPRKSIALLLAGAVTLLLALLGGALALVSSRRTRAADSQTTPSAVAAASPPGLPGAAGPAAAVSIPVTIAPLPGAIDTAPSAVVSPLPAASSVAAPTSTQTPRPAPRRTGKPAAANSAPPATSIGHEDVY
jgi:serine/threonine protein kinase